MGLTDELQIAKARVVVRRAKAYLDYVNEQGAYTPAPKAQALSWAFGTTYLPAPLPPPPPLPPSHDELEEAINALRYYGVPE